MADQLTPASDKPIHGQVRPLEASSPDPNLPINRKVTAPDMSPTMAAPHLSTVQNFPAVKDEASLHSSAEDSKFPHQVEQQPDKSVMVGQGVTIHQAEASTVEENGSPNEKGELVTSQPTNNVKRNAKRLSLRTELSSSVYAYERQHSRSKVQQQKDSVTSLRDKLLDFEQLDQPTASKLLLDLLTAANKLYRSGEKCPVCFMCLKDKSESGGQRRSHVISKGILQCYWKIHGTCEQAYIHDFSRNERLSAGSLTYQLLCGDCETEYSKTEQSLLSLYLNIAADPPVDLPVDVTVNHEDTDPTPLWLTYILANILLRGIVANINLDDCFQEQEIIDQINSLWLFCRAKLEDAAKMSVVPNLKVFFLRNVPFNESLNDFLYPFEMLLRMPRCTELIRHDKEGTFLYTKFDWVHVVLPLCETSTAYFETFNNGLEVENRNLNLRWALHPKTEIHRQRKSITFTYPPECTTLKDHFPEVLLRWCASLYADIVSKIHNHPCLNQPSLAYVERYSGSKYIGFSTDERMHQAVVLKERKLFDKRESRIAAYKEISKEKLKKCDIVSEASKHSPLRRISELMCLREESIAMKAELKEKTAAIEVELKEKAALKAQLEKNATALADANKTVERAWLYTWNLKAELDQNAAVLDQERLCRQKWEKLCLSQSRTHKDYLERIKRIYLPCLRKNRAEEQETIEQLKQLINDMGADFEYFAQVTQDAQCHPIHQTYKELLEQCNSLVAMSPPTTPSSPTPHSPYI